MTQPAPPLRGRRLAFHPMAPAVARKGGNARAVPSGDAPYGVLDIGSNSIRLVIYEALGRAPAPIFNERALCGLGRGLAGTRRLWPDAIDPAIETLQRFAAVAETLSAEVVDAVATAAVREAIDGPAFLARVQRETGLEVRVLTGREEARLSADGVAAAFPGATGLVADLGGGSLELIRVRAGQTEEHETLPLGALRATEITPKRAAKTAAAELGAIDWLATVEGEPVYLVGGAWRALARLHIAKEAHPLPIVHHYELDQAAAREFAELLVTRGPAPEWHAAIGLSRRRLETVPYASAILTSLLRASGPNAILFSAYGLREGLLHDRLAPDVRDSDPLLAACRAMGARFGRSNDYGEALATWLRAADLPLAGFEPRLEEAAALVSEIARRDHPDFRAEHAFALVARGPFVAIDHPGRAFLGLAVASRYQSKSPSTAAGAATRLLDSDQQKAARGLGYAMRLAERLSCGDPAVLRRSRLELRPDRVLLTLDPSLEAMLAGKANSAFDALARLLDRDAETVFDAPAGADSPR